MGSIFYPILVLLGSVILPFWILRFGEDLYFRAMRDAWRLERKSFKRRIRGYRKWLTAFATLLVILPVFVAGWATGRPLLGLLSLPILPWGLPILVRIQHSLVQRKIDESAFSFFCALQGLIEVGVALPQALYQLSIQMQGPFARHLKECLSEFQTGESLDGILVKLHRKHELGRATLFIVLLNTIYQNGLGVLPLLEGMLPQLESSLEHRKRVQDMRRSVFIQAFVAAVVPFVLLVAMGVFQPEILYGFFDHGRGWFILGVAVLFETMGVLCIWKVSVFD